jgi:hypothetical protein
MDWSRFAVSFRRLPAAVDIPPGGAAGNTASGVRWDDPDPTGAARLAGAVGAGFPRAQARELQRSAG